jgi:hypothetical protein
MRFAVSRLALAVCCTTMLAACGCSKFAGEWIEEGSVTPAGVYKPSEGPRRMALKFEPIATVRQGAFVDDAGVVDGQVVSADTYYVMDAGKVAQFGSIIARLKGNEMITYIGAEESRHFKRISGPSIFPPRVYMHSLDSE